jgi:hypothetical protein
MRWLKKSYHITKEKEACKNGILEFRWPDDWDLKHYVSTKIIKKELKELYLNVYSGSKK